MKTTESVVNLDPKKVLVSTLNTRQPTHDDVAELRESIAAAGQISPAIVRPHPTKKGHYELVAGARRKVACQALGISLAAIVRDVADSDFEDQILTDNLQREDPDPMQEALLIERRLKEGASAGEIAARYGKTESWIKRRCKLLDLTPDARAARSPGMAFSHFTVQMMEYIASLPAEEQDQIADDPYATRDFATLDELLEDRRRTAPDLADTDWLNDPRTFIDGCGPGCATDTATSLFPDPERPCGSCSNHECFAKRLQLMHDCAMRDLLQGQPITDFVLIKSEGYNNRFHYEGKEHSALCGYSLKEKYKIVKSNKPGRVRGIDIVKPGHPVDIWLEPKDAKLKEHLAAGGTGKAPGQGEDPKDRLTGKRLAALNQRLDKHLAATPVQDIEGGPENILRYVAAFGMQSSRGHCAYDHTHKKAWAESFDQAAGAQVPLFDGGSGGTGTREGVIWKAVKEVLRGRLLFAKNSDLLPDWKRREMANIARVTGFDYAAEWQRICTREVPVPKSWGPGFDPVTLRKLTPEEVTAERRKRDAAAVKSVQDHARQTTAAQKARAKKAAKKKPTPTPATA